MEIANATPAPVHHLAGAPSTFASAMHQQQHITQSTIRMFPSSIVWLCKKIQGCNAVNAMVASATGLERVRRSAIRPATRAIAIPASTLGNRTTAAPPAKIHVKGATRYVATGPL